ncbi:MAG: TonB-dependent receptor domain-containing protein, partial [Fidelibacterota bacterium]
WRLSANGALVMNYFNNGNSLPNIPATLFNLSANYSPQKNMLLFVHWRRVGHMYVDNDNTEAGMIDPYGIWDIGARYQWGNIEAMVKFNNIFDKLYATYGYGYELDGFQAFYWPGATRNSFMNISYTF